MSVSITPYSVNVFARKFQPVGKPRSRDGYTRIAPCEYGYMLWTPEQTEWDAARLPSAGSFTFVGLFRVYRAAMEALQQSGVYQVQVRTNQDRLLYVWNRHVDGRVSGYGYTKQEWLER